jgi:hypothetical protein
VTFLAAPTPSFSVLSNAEHNQPMMADGSDLLCYI